MIKEIDIREAINCENLVFVDVRSESEYNDDTIPGAINIPILNDKERQHVGYVYTKVSKDEAKKIGLKYASNKLTKFYETAKNLEKNNKHLALFCYRGGMRSNSIAKILDVMGMDLYLIKGGYKNYRKYVVEELTKYKGNFKFIVLHGFTGTGKTKILQLLENLGEPILNLENLAQNSGSVFGNIAFENQSRTQKQFESLLLKAFINNSKSYFFTESESKRIGKVVLPEYLFDDMDKGYHIFINTSIDNRIHNIVDDYICNSSTLKDDDIRVAIKKLKRSLGNNRVNKLIEELDKKNYKYIAKELMLHYYDPLYKYSLDKIGRYDLTINYSTIDNAVKELIAFKNSLF